ncbi:hypothetical protein HZ326_30903 [Fusarium oxysporum f. sp. albedinis]|nr:hypothetical protein HZ326_30903 [Fusarium oxysporum f. sp. albedinis]
MTPWFRIGTADWDDWNLATYILDLAICSAFYKQHVHLGPATHSRTDKLTLLLGLSETRCQVYPPKMSYEHHPPYVVLSLQAVETRRLSVYPTSCLWSFSPSCADPKIHPSMELYVNSLPVTD